MFNWNPHPKQLEFLNETRRMVLWTGYGFTEVKVEKYATGHLEERINNNFRYHTPKNDQPARYELIRETARKFALLLAENTPTCREQSQALSDLEDCVMHANAAIARNE